MKKKTVLAAVMIMTVSTAITACGSKETAVSETKAESMAELTVGDTPADEETLADEISSTDEQAPAGEKPSAGEKAPAGEKPSAGEKAPAGEKPSADEKIHVDEKTGSGEKVYEDNFAVEAHAAAEFADRIKAAVADKDMEALADLMSFPVYVEIAESGAVTREDFMALGGEKVFTPELISSIEGADTSNLSPSMAGFVLSKDGNANIIFGVVNGRLAISGINY